MSFKIAAVILVVGVLIAGFFVYRSFVEQQNQAPDLAPAPGANGLSSEQREQAERELRDVYRIGDIRVVQIGLLGYFDELGVYPVQTKCGALPSSLVTKGYLSELPAKSLSPESYSYASNAAGTDYVLRADLEDAGHVALENDLVEKDGLVFTCDCNDSDGYFCIQP